jgi:serine/threonine protein kinase
MNLIGETISQYRVLREVGHGGMATVYEAEDALLDRHVALKVINEDLLRDAAAVALFEREARAAAALVHPNICTVHELIQYKGRPVIVMEFLAGETLRQMLRRGPLPVDQTIDIAIALADALEAAHTKGIVHRDIKPSNVMFNERGQPKLLDFGLAKSEQPSVSGDEPESEESVFGGTTQFMSPEQTLGEECDARSDLFSLGIMLYEMTTSQRPFTRRSALATMEAIRTVHPASPHALNPQVPEGLELIIAKLLEKNPDNRYQSAADLRADLESLKLSAQAAEAEWGRAAIASAENGIPPIAGAEPPADLLNEERLVTRVWRRRAWYVAPFVIAALLFLLLAGILLYRHLIAAGPSDELQRAKSTRTPQSAAAPSTATNATPVILAARSLLLQPWSTAAIQTRNNTIATTLRLLSHICHL